MFNLLSLKYIRRYNLFLPKFAAFLQVYSAFVGKKYSLARECQEKICKKIEIFGEIDCTVLYVYVYVTVSFVGGLIFAERSIETPTTKKSACLFSELLTSHDLISIFTGSYYFFK